MRVVTLSSVRLLKAKTAHINLAVDSGCVIVRNNSPLARKRKSNGVRAELMLRSSYLMFGACGNRANVAAWEYAERYPTCYVPKEMFRRLE
jgi:hypothetical protein